MFIGHFAAGFAAKKIDNRPSLGTLFLAAQFIDLIWPIFLLLGLEKVRIDPGNTAFTPLDFVYYPFTHSFFGVLIWGALFGLVYHLYRKNLKGALLLGGLVLSHWFLDLLVHRPDLPLVPWSDIKVGFGLWQSVPLTMIAEGLLFAVGVGVYFFMTRADNRKGKIALWGFVLFLIIIYLANIFGTPPPSEEPIAYVGLLQWILVAWGYWIDRNHRVVAI